jgi:hypothetical protein
MNKFQNTFKEQLMLLKCGKLIVYFLFFYILRKLKKWASLWALA